MKSLIERLQKASGPDRELDADIDLHFLEAGWREERKTLPFSPPHYTSSLDAAMTLVPERHDWSIFCDNGEAIAGCQPASEDGCDITDCHGATPAIALCIAALRARDGGKG